MAPNGYPSNDDINSDNTLVDNGFAGCPGRSAVPAPPATAYTHGVVTPHASFLSLRWDRTAVLENLQKLKENFPIHSTWGFADSVDVTSGKVSQSYLSLDQGIVLAAIGNEVGNVVLPRAFAGPDLPALV